MFPGVAALIHISDVLLLRVIPGKWAYPVQYSPYSLCDYDTIPITASSGDSSILDQMYHRTNLSDLNAESGEQAQHEVPAHSPERPGPVREDTVGLSSTVSYESLEWWATRPNGVSTEMVQILPAYVVLLVIVTDCVVCINSEYEQIPQYVPNSLRRTQSN